MTDEDSGIAALRAEVRGMQRLADNRYTATCKALDRLHGELDKIRDAIAHMPSDIREVVKDEVEPVRELTEKNRACVEALNRKIRDWRLMANLFRGMGVAVLAAFLWCWTNVEGFSAWILTRLKT